MQISQAVADACLGLGFAGKKDRHPFAKLTRMLILNIQYIYKQVPINSVVTVPNNRINYT